MSVLPVKTASLTLHLQLVKRALSIMCNNVHGPEKEFFFFV